MEHHPPHHDNDGLEITEVSSDPSHHSLAGALRASFRVLTLIMLAVLGFYAISGLNSIEEEQKGIGTFTGEVTGVYDAGLAYTVPFPLGDLEVIETRNQTLEINDFWMQETPEDKAKDLDARRARTPGLKPGADGALLTGDRYLLHAKIEVTWRIKGTDQEQSDEILNFKRNVLDTDETIRSAVCSASIRSAATKTADSLLRGAGKQALTNDIRRLTQAQLDRLESGIQVTLVNLTISAPLRARPAYNRASRARSEQQQLRDAAIKKAQELLASAAGDRYPQLVGRPWAADPQAEARFAAEQGQAYDLIGQYARAREARNQDTAEAILSRIDEQLTSQEMAGDASTIIADARTYWTSTIQRIKGRYERFREILAAYDEAPEFWVRRLWDQTLEEILSDPTVEKHFVREGMKMPVLLGRDPEMVNQLRRRRLESKRDTGEIEVELAPSAQEQ